METQVILRRSSLAAALALLWLAPAHAQALLSVPSEEYSRGRNVGVAERPHPEYDAAGMPLGAFRLYPTLSAQAVHTDNVFATDSGKVSDTFARIASSFSVTSDWSRNAVGFGAQVSHDVHADVTSEDSTSYSVQAGGRYEITPDVIGTLLAEHEHGVEARESSTSAALAVKPSEYDRDSVNLVVVNQIDQLRLRGSVSYVKSDYEDLPAFGGGVVLNDLRDDEVVTYGARADFALSPDTAVFASLSYNTRDFTHPDGLSTLDSKGYAALAGANFDVTTLIRGELGVGYFDQTLKRGGHSSGLAAAGRLHYYPTQLTDITLTANRGFVDSTVAGTSGVVRTSADISVDHELLRNLLLNAKFQVSRDDYAEFDGREDRTLASLGATWRVNRGVTIDGAIQRKTQDSDGSILGLNYETTYVFVGISLKR
jgi:hypothetical protein